MTRSPVASRAMRWIATGWIPAGAVVLLALTAASPASAAPAPTWLPAATNVDARLRGLSAVSPLAAWVSGDHGTILRTVDGGHGWDSVAPAGTEELDFRDIQAFDADRAVALSIGAGERSRIYRTDDGGRHWSTVFTNPDPRAFYDCLAFFDRQHGLVVGDPVDGTVQVLITADAGRTWQPVPGGALPAALSGEAQFAASGQCVATDGARDAWIGTGGGARARVLHSGDRGRTWTVADTPLASGPSAGVFAVAFRDPRHGLAIGGDYAAPTATGTALALSEDGGRTWRAPRDGPAGYRSGVAWLAGSTVIAVGPTGSDLSLDGGWHWHRIDSGSFDTVDCAFRVACWAAGEHGRVVRLSPPALPL